MMQWTEQDFEDGGRFVFDIGFDPSNSFLEVSLSAAWDEKIIFLSAKPLKIAHFVHCDSSLYHFVTQSCQSAY